MSQTDLEQRISAALNAPDLKAAELATLLDKTQAAIVAADTAAAVERDRSLDPALTDDPGQARQAAEDAVIASGRLTTLKNRLAAKLGEVQQAERLDQWLDDYLTHEAKQDKLVEEFRAYPEIVAKLVDLFQRMAAFDAELNRLHSARPAGVSEHLLGAELTARGLTGFTRDQPSIIKTVQLPQFENSRRMAWPPPVPSAAAAFAASMMLPQHRGPDWWRDGDARAAEQAAEAKRVSDHYAEQARLRDERDAAVERTRAEQARRAY